MRMASRCSRADWRSRRRSARGASSRSSSGAWPHARSRRDACDDARERIERALALARETGMGFCGPMVLGIKARMLDDAGEREQCRAEAEALLAQGCAEPQFDPVLPPRHRGRAGAPRMGARSRSMRLRSRPTREPSRCPTADFLIARARVLIGLASRPADQTLQRRARAAARRGRACPVADQLAGRVGGSCSPADRVTATSGRDHPPRMAQRGPLRAFLREQVVGQRVRGKPARRNAETDAARDLESYPRHGDGRARVMDQHREAQRRARRRGPACRRGRARPSRDRPGSRRREARAGSARRRRIRACRRSAGCRRHACGSRRARSTSRPRAAVPPIRPASRAPGRASRIARR